MKRGLIASAVASMLFAGAVAGVGAINAVETTGVPMPGPGAVATYSAMPLGGGTETDVTGITLQWNPIEQVRAQDFALHNAWRMDMLIDTADGDAHRYWAYYDAESGEALLDGQETVRTGAIYDMRGPLGVPSYGQTRGEIDLAFDLYHVMRGVCGMADGHRLDAKADQVRLGGHCSRWDDAATTTFDRIGDLRYQNPDDERFIVAYEPGVPFPTELTVPLSDMVLRIPHTDAVWRLELQEWQGAPAYPPVPGIVDAGPGPVERLPITDAGLDDSAVDHPFPLSQAVAAAILDEQSPRVAHFLDERPQAYVLQAWSSDWIDGSGNAHHNWWITWSDGQDWITKRVVDRPGQVMGYSHPALPRQIDVEAWSHDGMADRPKPAPAQLPASLPDPAQVMDRHALFSPEDLSMNRYGFGHYCQVTCDDVVSLVAGGWFTMDTRDDDPFIGTRQQLDGAHYQYDQLMVLGDGTVTYTERASWSAPPRLEPIQSETAPEQQSGEDAVWSPPSSQAVASAGALALLGGILVYLAPLAKVPAVALFSRIRGEHLLEHPTRSAIMAAVEAEPGIHFQDLSRRLELGKSTLEHHLKKLTQARHLVVKVSPGYTCYFPRRTDRAVMAAAPFLRSPGPRKILEEVVHGSNGTVAAIARTTGLSTSTVSHHLNRMKAAGLVAGGGRAGFRATAKAQHVV